MKPQLLFIQSTPPHGSIIGQEGLDACLMGSAFAECAVLFLNDGIYQIVTPQDTKPLGLKDYSVSFGALKEYGVSNIYCRETDLAARHLTTDQLSIEVQSLSDAAAQNLVNQAEQVLTF